EKWKTKPRFPTFPLVVYFSRKGGPAVASLRLQAHSPIRKCCACAGRSRIVRNSAVVIGILLLENINESLPTDDVHPTARGVIKQVIRVAHNLDRRSLLPALRVERQHSRRGAASDQQPMMPLVERHRIVSQRRDHGP